MKIKKLFGLLALSTIIMAVIFAWFYFVNKNPLEQFIPTVVAPKLSEPPKFLFNIYGEDQSDLNSPQSLALDQEGNIFVTDTENHRIAVFNPDGIFLRHIGNDLPGESQLAYPYGILVDSGKVYVADGYLGMIKVFSTKGQYLKTFSIKDMEGKRILSVGPMALDAYGSIYAVDMQGARILVFDKEGQLKRTFGYHGKDNQGGLSFPNGITTTNEGNLLVTDAGNQRVVEFTTEGKFVRLIFGEKDKKGEPFSILRGITSDPYKRIMVVDTILHGIHTFSEDGDPLFVIGEMGFDEGQFLYPVGIAIDKEKKRIYICDSNNNRISVWRL